MGSTWTLAVPLHHGLHALLVTPSSRLSCADCSRTTSALRSAFSRRRRAPARSAAGRAACGARPRRSLRPPASGCSACGAQGAQARVRAANIAPRPRPGGGGGAGHRHGARAAVPYVRQLLPPPPSAPIEAAEVGTSAELTILWVALPIVGVLAVGGLFSAYSFVMRGTRPPELPKDQTGLFDFEPKAEKAAAVEYPLLPLVPPVGS